MTDLGFSYELVIDIDLDFPASDVPNWQQIRFSSAVAPQSTPTMLDAATYDDRGAANQVRVGEADTLGFTVQVQRNVDGTYLPELQKLIDAAAPGIRGKDGQVHLRYYDSEGAAYAREGHFTVQADRQNTGNAETGGWAITATSAGPVQVIANPGTPGTAAPVVTSALPSGAAEGEQVTVRGSGFAAATGVTLGGVDVDDLTVIGDSVIVLVVPADEDAPRQADIVVTSPAGTSTAFPYSRGA